MQYGRVNMPTKALIPIPSTLEPLGTVCRQFLLPNDGQYLGIFWGALDQLTRWNSYQRDEANSGAALALIWRQIIEDARTSECAVLVACPSAFLYEDTIPGITQGHDNTRNYWPLAQCSLQCIGDSSNAFNGWVALHDFALRTEESLIFVDGGYNIVGTHVCELRAERIGSFATWFFTLKYMDCAGFIHTQTFSPPQNRLEKLDFEAQWIWIECNSDFNWTCTFDGPILCGPA